MEDEIFLKTKIRVQFQLLKGFPRILQACSDGVFINRNAPYPNELEYITTENIKNLYEKSMVKTEKLIFKNAGNKKLNISMIKSEYFDDRQMFDNLIADKEITQEIKESIIETISFREALIKLNIQIYANMDYYLLDENTKELEVYFGRKFSNKDEAMKLENELFAKLMAKLFDLSDANENESVLKDFAILRSDSGGTIATACNGNYFIAFCMFII